jgi:hypothetical protein
MGTVKDLDFVTNPQHCKYIHGICSKISELVSDCRPTPALTTIDNKEPTMAVNYHRRKPFQRLCTPVQRESSNFTKKQPFDGVCIDCAHAKAIKQPCKSCGRGLAGWVA